MRLRTSLGMLWRQSMMLTSTLRMNVTMGRRPGLDSAFVAGVSPDNASGSSGKSTSEQQADSGHPDSPDDDGLGPLPPNWEKAFTEKGEPYFIDHNSGILQIIKITVKYSKWFRGGIWQTWYSWHGEMFDCWLGSVIVNMIKTCRPLNLASCSTAPATPPRPPFTDAHRAMYFITLPGWLLHVPNI